MTLSEPQKKFLRGLGHSLKPLVIVGDAGLTASVLAEFEVTLAHHELIKARVRATDRAARDEIVARLCSISGAALVQRIGNVALLYRPNPEKKKNRLLIPN
jgi:RNA-binding protein